MSKSKPSWRDLIYAFLRFANDARAVRKGRVGKRIARRALGRASGKGIGRLTR